MFINNLMFIFFLAYFHTACVSVVETEIHLNETFRFLYDFFNLQSKQKGLFLSFKTPLPDEEAIVIADKSKLENILTNLIRNAIKFTTEGSVEFGYVPRENALEFYVTDSGIGIPTDKQDSIFDRFVQADISFNRPYEGSGLGLSISKAYIEMMGGTIDVESKENEGSTFRFNLPRKVNGKVRSETVSKPATGINPLLSETTILIAEDDDINYAYLQHVLTPRCKSVIRARNGIEAVNLCLSQSDINIVLMDIKMPKMDGYQAVKEIRKFNKEVIIIAQTAYTFKTELKKALAAGCNDHISKPFGTEKILEVIRKNLQSQTDE